MVKIYKYEIVPGGIITHTDRFVAALKVDWQGNNLYVWCLVSEQARESSITFMSLPTGYEFPYSDELHYLDSVKDGVYVWHIFYTLKMDSCKRTEH